MAEERRKRYYSISEVADILEVKPHILRYWEGEFSVLRPRKNRAGNRAYTERDIKIALAVKTLLYEDKYTIEGAKKRMKEDHGGSDKDQLEIPFEQLQAKNEIRAIRTELVELIDKIKAL